MAGNWRESLVYSVANEWNSSTITIKKRQTTIVRPLYSLWRWCLNQFVSLLTPIDMDTGRQWQRQNIPTLRFWESKIDLCFRFYFDSNDRIPSFSPSPIPLGHRVDSLTFFSNRLFEKQWETRGKPKYRKTLKSSSVPLEPQTLSISLSISTI